MPNISIIVDGKNNSGQTFQQIKADFDKMKQEIQRPIDGPTVRPRFDDKEQGGRDRRAGQIRGLRQRGEAAEESARQRLAGPGGALTANELRNEENERFRATKNHAAATKRAADETDSLAKFLKSGLIFGAIHKAAIAFSNIPAAIDSYRAMLKQGENKGAAFGKALFDAIPIVSQFADAGRAIRQVVEDLRHPSEARAREERDRAQEDRDTRDKIRDQQNQRRGQVGATGSAAAKAAQESLSTAGLQGDALTARQAQIELQNKLAEAANLRQQAGTFGNTADQDKIRKQAEQVEIAARNAFAVAINDIDRAHFEAEKKATQDHQEEMLRSQADFEQERLQAQGQTFPARLAQIKEQNRRELEEAKQKRQAELDDLIKNGAASNDPRWKAAQDRFRESEVAANQRAQERQAQARTDEQTRQAEEDAKNRKQAAEAEEEAAKQERQSRPRTSPAFTGESRLLTGVGSIADPLLAPTQQTAKATARAAAALITLPGDIAAAIAATITPSVVFDGTP